MLFLTQSISLATLPLLLSAAPLDAPEPEISLPLTKQSIASSSDVASSLSSNFSRSPINLTARADSDPPIVVPLTSPTGFIYAATVTIGTTPFQVVIDTAASELILPGPECERAVNEGRTIYHPPIPRLAANESSEADTGGITSGIEGYIRTATGVGLGGLTAGIHRLMVAVTLGARLFWDDVAADGVLGLRPTGLNYPISLLSTLISEGQLDPPVFSLLLRRDIHCHSELTLGVPNHDLYQGNFAYAPVLMESYWSVRMKISINGQYIVNNVHGRLSTSVPRILADSASVQAFYKALSPRAHRVARLTSSEVAVWAFPCSDADKPIMMSFGDESASFAFTRQSLVQNDYTSVCTGTIIEIFEFSPNTWILGSPFFHNLYVTFESNPNGARVGFADVSDAVKAENCLSS